MVGLSIFGFCSGGFIFFARDWNLYIINSSHVVGAIVWSFMELDAAWHEWCLIALAVVLDDVLAVSAQCWCCHHSVFDFMPYLVWYLLIIILHGFCLHFSFFLFDITWYMYCQDYGLCYWWGVLFCCLCTTTFLCVPYGPYAAYSFIFFLFCVLCTHFFIHLYPYVFLLPFCVVFFMLG